ncbi:MAG: ribonucleoside-diphosphate reductase subunit alpha, partial [Chlamydiota bacterium]|nr:ribonucleoside-diphosphate reductase subunit alpha [Chlamydiota bacterium]
MTDQVEAEASHSHLRSLPITVEQVQDWVEMSLMEEGLYEIAKDYILYREQHTQIRKDDPRNILLMRQPGERVRLNPIKIFNVFLHLFRDHEESTQLTENIQQMTEEVVQNIHALSTASPSDLMLVAVETAIEDALMKRGWFREAKAYILRDAPGEPAAPAPAALPSHSPSVLSLFTSRIAWATLGLDPSVIDRDKLLKEALLNQYEGMPASEVDDALIMSARSYVEKDPLYSQVTARLLLGKIYREVMGIDPDSKDIEIQHQNYFQHYIKEGIAHHQLSTEMTLFDIPRLAQAMDLRRDHRFLYLGIQTLYDRYFLHHEGRRLETPQIFWMRVAMGLSIREKEPTEQAIRFYHMLSEMRYLSATPTLFNSGTVHSQLSSCYLATIMDNLEHIFKTISDDAQLSKWAGGLGNDWSYVRSAGSHIRGTNGESQGIIPFLKVANDTAVAVNQGGKRKGAMCAYLETWHLDIEDFLDLRKNTGDERRRTHDMNTANWIPDLFMQRVKEKGKWTLFSPSDVPDLHDLYGTAFAKRYSHYEEKARAGKISLFKEVEAIDLWRKMLSMLFETGHPWITFKDPSNIRSPQDHAGVVHSSNLCTEILLNTSEEETAVCNLGSINLVEHLKEGGLDEDKLAETVEVAINMLDNVIDINFYPIEATERANLRHRAIGLGLMGFQDALHILGIPYGSHEAVDFADKSMEMISYYALLASSKLAKERGTYSTYSGSKWERGLLPIDTIDLLEEERGEAIDMDRTTRMNWSIVRDSIAAHGMRNSNVMAIAPTATIANIAGVSASIEPNYKNLYAKSNLSGEFTICNPYLVEALKAEGLWDEQMVEDLKYFDGSLEEIQRIPGTIKA